MTCDLSAHTFMLLSMPQRFTVTSARVRNVFAIICHFPVIDDVMRLVSAWLRQSRSWHLDRLPSQVYMPSGLQREVLHLYRQSLRTIRTKPAPSRWKFLLAIRYYFRVPGDTISPRDFGTIEFLLRKARRTLDTWQSDSVKDCWVSDEMLKWEKSTGGGWRQTWGKNKTN